MIGFVAAILLGLTAFGQSVLASAVAPAELCCLDAPNKPDNFANWGDEISDGARMVDQPLGSSGFTPDFLDGARSPGAGFEWRGNGPPGSRQGNWYNENTGASLHPDLGHPGPIGPLYDYKAPDGTWFRVFEDGRVEPK